jgi:hypothetical protein
MIELNFREWISKDLYGFGTDPIGGTKPDRDERPMAHINIEQVVTDLRHPINAKLPVESVANMSEMQWGNQPGALRCSFSPLGGLTATITRMAPDLQGHYRWITKKVIPLSQHYNTRDIDRSLSEDLLDIVGQIDNTPPEAPNGNFHEMDRWALRLAQEVKRRHPQVFEYQNIKRTEDHHHLIYFSLRGQGVQARGQHRFEQYIIDCQYEPEFGVIKVTGYGIQSKLGQHQWQITHPDFRHVFMPIQQEQEVFECILGSFTKY